MNYLMFSIGTWEKQASFVRLREFGMELLRRGHEVSYLVDDLPFNREKLELPSGSRRITVKPAQTVGQLKARRDAIDSLRPDVVHVINPSVKAFLALRGTDYRVVGDWDEWRARFPMRLDRRLRERFVDRWMRRRADPVVVCSRYLQEQFRTRYGLESVYIPYATYFSAEQTDTRESPFAAPTVLYMGNFYEHYDHDLLIHAAVELRRRGLTPPIELLGSGAELERWRRFVAEQGLSNVSLPGFTSGELLLRKLRHARVLVFPIRSNLPNLCRCPSKTFAYAQARRPIITCRVGEVPEVLADKATYVNPTPQAFAEAIADELARPDREVDYGVEKHNWAARTDTLLEALARRRRD